MRHPKVVVDSKRESSNPDYARGYCTNWESSNQAAVPEWHAIASLKTKWKAQPHPETVEYESYRTDREVLTVELNDYEIYASPEKICPGELTSLEFLDVRGKELWLDGVVSMGNLKYYVQKVKIKSYSIGGYGYEEGDDAVTEIYVQSECASKDGEFNIWYLLQRPSVRYRKYWKTFCWVTLLGKHVIDFMESQPRGVNIGLRSFQSVFNDWVLSRYPHNKSVKKWLAAHACTDFRKAVHAHIDYLSQEVYNLHTWKSLLKHDIWADCMRDDHHAITPQELVQSKTIATPHTFSCFKGMYFGGNLEEMAPSKPIIGLHERRKQLLKFPGGKPHGRLPHPPPADRSQHLTDVQIGEVVSFTPTEEEQRIWKEKSKEGESPTQWFAYVHNVEPMDDGTQRLYVIWMYRPEDTTISTREYPVRNEFFLSDYCNCKDPAIFSSEVARRCSVEWFATSFDSNKEYIVRQKYMTEHSCFVSLKKSDFQCDCNIKEENSNTYHPGDTVYVARTGAKFLSPVVVCGIDQERKEITARLLLRYQHCSKYPGYKPRTPPIDNELVWVEDLIKIPFRRVRRRCHIRFCSDDDLKHERIPYPYNRGGAGDCWVVSTRLVTSNKGASDIELLSAAPPYMNQGFSLDTVIEKLSGLSLFSGLGNLDKGLEQSGAVEFETSVDMCPEAIQTLHANAEHPDKLKLWLGSVDDYLATLLAGKDHSCVSQIGTIDVMAAGSPCPGFSALQINWLSETSLRNASHVTTFCSFVDIYRPKWAFLENVVNMAFTRKGYEDELVLSQLVACLVSMGYQVQQFIMSSWNYGSCQQRSRLILSIAAPGLPPLIPPSYTHSNPAMFRARNVGELRNGQKFGAQEDCLTPFPYVSAGQALGHLPDIANGLVGGCIAHPDHRVHSLQNAKNRKIMQCIPTDPPGQGLKQAVELKLVPPQLYQGRTVFGRAYKRMRKDGLVPTVLTAPSPSDARQGGIVHWKQHRPITIEEARLTQGIPSNEVIIGSAAAQMKMVGNAVDRRVSEQLGLALRHAFEVSLGIEAQGQKDENEVVYDSDCDEVVFEACMPTPTGKSEQKIKSRQYLDTKSERDSTVKVSLLQSVASKIAFDDDAIYYIQEKPIFSNSSTTSEEISRAWSSSNNVPSTDTSQPLLSVRTKRPFEDDLPKDAGSEETGFTFQPAKRSRQDDNSSSNSGQGLLQKSMQQEKVVIKKRWENLVTNAAGTPARGTSLPHDPTSRRTRHSGLEVEFSPRFWHKKPEFEAKMAEQEVEKGDPRPYA